MEETIDIFENNKNNNEIYADDLKYMPKSSVVDILSTSPLGTCLKGIVEKEDNSDCSICKKEKSNRFVGTSYVWSIDGEETSESYIADIIKGNSDTYVVKDSTHQADNTIEKYLDELKDGEALVYKVYDNFGLYDRLVVTRNPKYNEKFIMWNEDRENNMFNLVMMSSKDNAIYWIRKDALTYFPNKVKMDSIEEITENFDNSKCLYEKNYDEEDVELYYDDLYVTVYYGNMDWETGYGEKEFSGRIDYTYTVSMQDVAEFLVDFLYGKEPEYDKIDGDDESYEWIYEHFDELFEKYEKDILEYFRDDAEDDAQNNEHIEEYI